MTDSFVSLYIVMRDRRLRLINYEQNDFDNIYFFIAPKFWRGVVKNKPPTHYLSGVFPTSILQSKA